MRTLCDVCESAAAILFCAADEAALCRACDEKVHMCNKLHGTCWRKRTHSRYLLLRQKVEFPGDKSMPTEELARKKLDPGENKREYSHSPKPMVEDNQQNHRAKSFSLVRHLIRSNSSLGIVPARYFMSKYSPSPVYFLAGQEVGLCSDNQGILSCLHISMLPLQVLRHVF
ncbi:hypothetical protein HAX54_001305 [Datura stramonium]|uniref:B box-type domain-containing protein n=1 Tax=Datura stramonium TaxID=4076 RepID=A0ABS8RSH5_DATST|nr:hypothetical protein [Datura stramonium]